jgi:hypothetical protein
MVVVVVSMLVAYQHGYRLRIGPSMGQTIGIIYRVDVGAQPTYVNQFVVVEEPEESRLKRWWSFPRRWFAKDTAKRVVEIQHDGVVVMGDNDERSQDSRDWRNAVIPWNKVRGVIVSRWPSAKSFRDQVTWRFPPRDQLWSEDSSMVAIAQGGELIVLERSGRETLLGGYAEKSWEGHPIVWRNGRLAYKPDKRPFVWAIWDPRGPGYSFDLAPVYAARCAKLPKFGPRSIEKFEMMAADFGGQPRILTLPKPVNVASVVIDHDSAAPVTLTVNGRSVDANIGQTTLSLGASQLVRSVAVSFSGAGNIPTAEVKSITFR